MDEAAVKARKDKVCQEIECEEAWANLNEDVRNTGTAFQYCPFCANEMVTRCSVCHETISDTEFRFCPWCGVKFED